jgi:hypothetical protein
MTCLEIGFKVLVINFVSGDANKAALAPNSATVKVETTKVGGGEYESMTDITGNFSHNVMHSPVTSSRLKPVTFAVPYLPTAPTG